MDRTEISTSLLAFTKWVFKEIKRQNFIENHHHLIVAKALERVILGDCKRLIINIPPRYTKTEMAVVNFIAFCLQIFPDSEFIHASYSSSLAQNNASSARDIVSSIEYQEAFPHVRLKTDTKSKKDWRTDRGGVVYSTGSGGTITGFGAGKMRPGFGGAIIIDDPHKASEADSDVIRQSVIDWFQNTVESRCNSPDTPIIVIMQRLHHEDLSGFLLSGDQGEEWDHLCLPVENEDGTPLWEWKHNRAKLDQMKAKNSYVYAGQYLQTPTPLEGGIVQRIWLNRYDEPPSEFIRVIQSWDTAYKDKQHNDPSVCTTWGQTRRGYYLLDVFKDRLLYPDVKRMAKSLAEKWNVDTVLIEDKASGQSLIQELREETMLDIVAIQPNGDKLTRLMAVTSAYEAGRVFLPTQAPWLPDYETELFLFPNVTHDDQVDSTSQAIRWMLDTVIRAEYASAGRRAMATAGEIDDTGYGRVRSSMNLRGY